MHNLLQKPAAQVLQDLGRLDMALRSAFPLKTRHRKDLPDAVRELSALLTVDRGQSKAYWSSPRLLSAYLHYFLPWNLIRMAWLLPGLPLFPDGPGKVLDLGSGPLTFPLGLWLSRPDLRAGDLSFVCSDPAAKPMESGRDLYTALRGEAKGWPMRLVSLPMEKTLSQYRDKARLITALNVFNEIGASRHESLEERLEAIFYRMDRLLEPGGQILIVEPGTRLGGKIISLFRSIALEAGFQIQAPCPHTEACPYMADKPEDDDADRDNRHKGGARRGRSSGWCHFSHQARLDIPGMELFGLSQAAGLDKDSLHLSCLLLRKSTGDADAGNETQPAKKTGTVTARIISDPIRLPGRPPARYGCSKFGLVLMEDAAGIHSGSLVSAPLPHTPQTDTKTGAMLLKPGPSAAGARKRPANQASGPASGAASGRASKSRR